MLNGKKKHIQLVIWDKYFQDELMTKIKQQNAETTNAVMWSQLIDDVCKAHFPEADEYKLVFNTDKST